MFILRQLLYTFKRVRTPCIHILRDKEKDMGDYLPLQSNHKLPQPAPEEDQEGQHPIVVDFVYNTYEDRNGKTFALKVSLQLPLK